tara:strand:+ start:3026 stop:3367 length:342 start_codon:yes stop_codon:yes gene_type:complete
MKLDSKLFNEIINEALEGAKEQVGSMERGRGPRNPYPQDMPQEVYYRTDPREIDPDHVRYQLMQASEAAAKISQMINDEEIRDGLIHAKIGKASDYLTSVLHYLEYKEKRGER